MIFNSYVCNVIKKQIIVEHIKNRKIMKTINSNNGTKNLFAKTLTSVTLLDSMKLFFATNKETFKITRKTGAKNLYDKLMVHIMKTIPTLSNVYTLSKQLEAYGIKNYTDLSTLLLERRDDFLEANFKLKCVCELSEAKLDSMDLVGRAFIKENGKGKQLETCFDYEEEDEDDEVRTVVVRTKYGNGPIMSYQVKGKIGKNTMNPIKMAYRYETGVSYYESRPILLNSWLKLDDEHKNATCPLVDGDSDLAEIA